MKQLVFKNCSPLTHPRTVQDLHHYMQTVGEKTGRYLNRIYGGKKYFTRIRQTKANIIIEVL